MVRMTIEFVYRCMITTVILIGVSQVAMFAAAFGPHAIEEPMVNVMRFFLALGILSGTLALMGGAWGVLRKIGSRLGGPFRSQSRKVRNLLVSHLGRGAHYHDGHQPRATTGRQIAWPTSSSRAALTRLSAASFITRTPSPATNQRSGWSSFARRSQARRS